MYEDLFNILTKHDLTSHSKIEKAIMRNLSLPKAVQLGKELYLSIEKDSSPRAMSDIKNYQFLANSRMSALHKTGCDEWECRLQRVDKLARFACLYSDCVYIQNYFYYFLDISAPISDPHAENMRSAFVADLKILLEVKPLILNGIIRFTPSIICVCKDCMDKLIQNLEPLDSKLSKVIKELDKSLSASTSAQLKILPKPHPVTNHRYEIHVECDEDLFEHGEYVELLSSLPPVLQRKIANNPSANMMELSKSEIVRAHINTTLLRSIAKDIHVLKFHQLYYNLKYLTDRNIDLPLLHSVTTEAPYLKYNDIFSSYIVFEMPIFQNLPLEHLLEIRRSDYDSFISYREPIDKLIQEYVSQKTSINASTAQQLYGDLIRPEVAKLDKKIKEIRKSKITRALKNIIISTGSLTFGLFPNTLSPEIRSALIGFGLLTSKAAIESIENMFKTPGEVKNSNLYFLWKLSKKSKVI